ncbi:DUF461 domain-containing protein [Streptomyces sp. NPDC058001]|uniref:DUF461 domain-containing protein n=1 Tax=Streptomyces sp. NPDC058001 TaxID=3346300 RepID=UPI0036E6E6C0
MSRSLRRGTLAATVLAFSVASLAACGAGTNAQTLQVKPDNAATSVGDIQIQNATIITQPDPKATGPAVVSATVFNHGTSDQTLDSITVTGTGKAALKPATGSGPLTVPAGGSVVIGGKGNASAVLASGRESVQNGNAQPVTFTFSKTGDVKLESFVVPASGYFSGWGPSELPSPSASPSTSPSTSPGTSTSSPGAPGSTPSGSPSESTSESATTGH